MIYGSLIDEYGHYKRANLFGINIYTFLIDLESSYIGYSVQISLTILVMF